MRAVVQRVSEARVEVGGKTVGQIGAGLLVLASVGKDDTDRDTALLAEKLANLRIFTDMQGKMNLSVLDTGGAVLLVSQFTLHGDARKGRRPAFVDAMEPRRAAAMFDDLVEAVRGYGLHVETGLFAADMDVTLTNRGPVTILIDTGRLF